MMPEHGEAHFLEDEHGALSTTYGPYLLRSAFQPIFSQGENGHLCIEAFEALIRPQRNGEMVAPVRFFTMVEANDAFAVDALCRQLHLRNAARIKRPDALYFINFNPGLFKHGENVQSEVRAMLDLCHACGISPRRVVCEITEHGSDEDALADLVQALRNGMFRIAIDDYGADDSEIARVDRLKPDVIKFDAAWVRRFYETPAGQSLLRLMVGQFVDRGILCLFEGLEEESQIAFCHEIGVHLMQGYALARPQLAPTDFETRFPDHANGSLQHRLSAARAAIAESGSGTGPARPLGFSRQETDIATPAPQPAARRAVPFGRRQR
ncbi:EAL domain-containing protein [Pseudohoeflea coraliihabitans]|uniref:EAL domain-containing protein n=1 Tax=Pseudohoeflea coraliihabitans TaxID=2860393 RepID=A0ABS6WJF5_9HYPH|nr:EAL domain-containing protein [Pseudohoeflea sp. DP4N28-3]MBW3096082.1 EAL domain-containing protein [Pseudohoeflea sp. DP4N28-3]